MLNIPSASDLRTSAGYVIARRRSVEEMTQAELAERAGLHKMYISQLERGLKMPTLETLYKLAWALEVEVDVLLREITKATGG